MSPVVSSPVVVLEVVVGVVSAVVVSAVVEEVEAGSTLPVVASAVVSAAVASLELLAWPVVGFGGAPVEDSAAPVVVTSKAGLMPQAAIATSHAAVHRRIASTMPHARGAVNAGRRRRRPGLPGWPAFAAGR